MGEDKVVRPSGQPRNPFVDGKMYCFICENPIVEPTREHVVPEQLYDPDNKPPNLYTLKSCKSCNNSLASIEESFRNDIVAQCYPNPLAENLWANSIRRSFTDQKSKRLRMASNLSGERGVVPFRDSAGNVIGPGIEYHFSRATADPVIEKIVRGLYFKHYGRLLGKVAVQIRFYGTQTPPVAEDLRPDILEMAYKDSTGGGVLEYACTEDSNLESRTIWWLEFYESILFIVDTFPKTSESQNI